MKLFSSIFLWSCLITGLSKSVESKEWRGLIPLHSTRSDVERLLGVKSSGRFFDKFTINEERVFIIYSEKPCETSKAEGFTVPVGTVLTISVTPSIPIPLSNMNLSLDEFDVEISNDLGGVKWYRDKKNGFLVEVQEEMITNFSYLPTATDSDRLRCKFQ